MKQKDQPKAFKQNMYSIPSRSIVPCVCIKCTSSLNVYYDEKNDYCLCHECIEAELELLEELKQKDAHYYRNGDY